MNNLSVLSVNVRGLNSYEKRNKLFTWLEEHKIEITLLQETQFIEKIRKCIKKKLGRENYTCICFPTPPLAELFPFFFSKKCNIDILNVHTSKDGRKLLVNAEIEDE